MTCNCL